MFKYNETAKRKVTVSMSFFELVMDLKALILLSAFILLGTYSSAQVQEGAVKLKSGIVLKGEIVDLAYNDFVRIVLLKDTAFIDWEEIAEVDLRKVVPESVQYIGGRRHKRAPQPYTMGKTYFTLDMANRFGYSPWLVLNPGFSLGVGHNLTENLAVGGTAGVDFYWSNLANLYPLGVEGTYRFQKEGFTPFVKLRAGIALVENRPRWWGNEITVEQGPFLGPSIGIANKKREHAGWHLSLSTMITEVRETGTNTVFDGQQWINVPFSRTRNMLRTGIVFGLYLE